MNGMTGFAFPMAVNSATGKILMAADLEDDIKQSIYLILHTARGERPALPDFGVGLSQYVFETVRPELVQRISSDVKSHLAKWEKRITDIDVSVDSDPQHPEYLHIRLSYIVVTSAMADNYSLSLYMKGGTDHA